MKFLFKKQKRPNNIFLIRHGESIANVDIRIYKTIPDWKITLTEKGHRQAEEAALILRQHISAKANVGVYCSPFYRTRQTALPILNQLKHYTFYEDPRLREQEWGNYYDDEVYKHIIAQRKEFGSFFYRMPNGESGADVFDRISSFLNTLFRDFEEKRFTDVIIVTHGLAMRLFLMRWFHWPQEKFETLKNPSNCKIVRLVRKQRKYQLQTELAKNIERVDCHLSSLDQLGSFFKDRIYKTF